MISLLELRLVVLRDAVGAMNDVVDAGEQGLGQLDVPVDMGSVEGALAGRLRSVAGSRC